MAGQAATNGRRFRVVILSGPSGTGKSTIVDRLVAESPIPLHKAISATTRPPRRATTQPPRRAEEHGVDYYFWSQAEFEARRERGEFLECEQVYSSGNWYGTLKSELDEARAKQAWALLEIDVAGARRVVEVFPDAITIFLTTKDETVYEDRLRKRGTEDEAVIQRRLATARQELAAASWYRHQVVNDRLEQAIADMVRILRTEAEGGNDAG